MFHWIFLLLQHYWFYNLSSLFFLSNFFHQDSDFSITVQCYSLFTQYSLFIIMMGYENSVIFHFALLILLAQILQQFTIWILKRNVHVNVSTQSLGHGHYKNSLWTDGSSVGSLLINLGRTLIHLCAILSLSTPR